MAGFIAFGLSSFFTLFTFAGLFAGVFTGTVAGIAAIELYAGFLEEGEGVTEVGCGAVVEGVGLQQSGEVLDEVALLEEGLGRRVFGEIGR